MTTLRSARAVAAMTLLLMGTGVAGAAPGDYKARRFDVVAAVVNGNLEVRETVTFEFQSGTFKTAWRDVPASRTDGITVLDAAMDGVPVTAGDGPGHYALSRQDGAVRVEWRFAEVGPSSHRFDLHYVARGVVYRDGGSDVVRWRALPSEHKYAIDESRILIEPAGADLTRPETHRIASISAKVTSEGTILDVSGIRSNGWVIAELRYGAGVLIAQDPEWRQRDVRARAAAPTGAMGAAALFVAGVCLIAFMRQGYPAPDEMPAEATTTAPPQPLPAVLASVLTAKGALAGYQSMATILDLADRGVLRVTETRRTLGVRTYELSQIPGRHDLDTHETEALSLAFADEGEDVVLSKARGRLARRSARFNAAVNADLVARGLIDPERKAIRDRVMRVSLLMLPAALIGSAALAPLVSSYEGWPFLLTLGLFLASMAGFVMGAQLTPLSDQGLVESARWRGFRRHLKSLATNRDEGMAAVPSRWIVYAIGAGLASQWSRYLKRHPDAAPDWFLSAGADSGGSFAAFVGSHAAAGGGGGGGGGGAAGGGGSGAG